MILRRKFAGTDSTTESLILDEQTKALVKAIKEKNYTEIRSLVLLPTKPIDINAVIDDRDNTALLLATSLGDFRAVDILAQVSTLDVNAQNKSGSTALILAAKGGFTNILKTISSFPETDMNHKNRMGQSAFLLACANGQTNTVDILRHNEQVDVKSTDIIGNNGLMLAASNGHIKTVRILKTDGRINLNDKNNHGQTALMMAERNQRPSKAECLALLMPSTPKPYPRYDF